ncbi:lipopolysaccharide biosynthesis protein [Pontibacter mangrovi]|uniref:Polysaccharide biosynthesis protein n=1 Tax=Pontibacter mangrovi TaxID=2589816 RepID=A0A501W2W4_9BACT|nr:hypothetical protein [Pontibacter mangrovi]TPE39986.1 hypothetical protein FJM65_20460 [Pontibacter mangrovi]
MLPQKFQNIAWQLAGAFFNRGAFFLAMLILADKLALEEYGRLGLLLLISNSISGIVVPPLGLNIRNELIEIDFEKRKTYLSQNIAIIFAFVIAVSSILSFWIVFEFGSTALIYPILFFLHTLFLTIFNFLNYFYSGIDEFKAYNKRTLWTGVLMIPFIFFFPIKSAIYPLIIFTSAYFVSVLYLLQKFRYRNSDYFSIDFLSLKEYINCRRSILVPIFLQSLVNLPVLSTVQFIIVSFTANYKLIGIITFATQITNLVSIIVNRVNSVTIPALNKIKTKRILFRKKVVTEALFLFGLSFTASLVVSFLIPTIISFTDNKIMAYRYEIVFYVIANLTTYAYWYAQEVNIIIKENWKVFYANLIWAAIVILTTLLIALLGQDISLTTYSILVIGSRGLIVLFLIKNIIEITKYEKKSDKVFV